MSLGCDIILPPDIQERVVGVVTLGTPFIFFREHWSEVKKYAVIRGLRHAAIGSSAASIALLALLLTRLRWIELLQVFVTVLVWGLFKWMTRVSQTNWNLAARQVIERYQPALESNIKLLAVATNVDEAGWWLRLLLFPARLFDSVSFRGLDSFARLVETPAELPRGKYRVGIVGGDFVANLLVSFFVNVAFLILEPVLRVVAWALRCWLVGIVGVAQFALGFVGRSFGRSAPWGYGESWMFPWLVDVWTEPLPVGATAYQVLRSKLITTLDLHAKDAGQTQLAKFAPKKICSPHSWLHDDLNVIGYVTEWVRGRFQTASAAGAS
jgi:hypothetical protein